MREAVVEAKVAVMETRDTVARTEREVAQERQRLADAERRGRLPSEIPDAETAAAGRRVAAEHPGRAGGPHKKQVAPRDERSPLRGGLPDKPGRPARAVQ